MPPATRFQSQQKQRCSGGHDSAAAAPAAVFVLLVVVSLTAAAWNAQMAVTNAHTAKQFREAAAAHCRAVSGVGGGGSSQGRESGNLGARADIGDGGVCMVEAAELLQQAEQIGRQLQPTTATAALATSSTAANGSFTGTIQAKTRTLAHLSSAAYSEDNSMPRCVAPWTNETRRGFIVTGNISNSCGGLLINTTGYYFVYSQVGYDISADDSELVMPSTDHMLVRYRAAKCARVCSGRESDKADVLARARKTRCWGKAQKDSVTSSYVGAVFRLNMGDVVTLYVDRLRYVSRDSFRTYLGAFFISL